MSTEALLALVREFLTSENLAFSRATDARVPRLYAMLDERPLSEQVAAARNGDRKAWNCCLAILENHILRRQPIPREMEGFVVDTMSGKVAVPGDRKRGKSFEHRVWAKAVQMLNEKASVNPMRNDESTSVSGCDIVADAVNTWFRNRGGELDGTASYAAVKKAYLAYSKQIKTKARNV